MANILELSEKAVLFIGFQAKLCCTIKVDIRNSKSQYIEKDKQESRNDGSEPTKIQHEI